MNVLVSVPIAPYQALLGRCLLASREYAVLKNSVINHVPTNRREGNIVEILCEVDDAKLILDLAKRVYPTAVPYIEEAISPGCDTNRGSSLTAPLEESKHAPAEYRIKTSGDTRHLCSNCSQWPTSDFILSKDLPDNGQICNECLQCIQPRDDKSRLT